MIKVRIIYAAIGLAYSLLLGFWAMLLSGGGHFNLPLILITSPFWLGLFLWPIWAYMAAGFNSILSKCLFLLSMIAHFGYIVAYLLQEWRSDLNYFRLALQEPLLFPIVILFPGSVFVAYILAHIFLWRRFLNDTFARSRSYPLEQQSRSVNAAT